MHVAKSRDNLVNDLGAYFLGKDLSVRTDVGLLNNRVEHCARASLDNEVHLPRCLNRVIELHDGGMAKLGLVLKVLAVWNIRNHCEFGQVLDLPGNALLYAIVTYHFVLVVDFYSHFVACAVVDGFPHHGIGPLAKHLPKSVLFNCCEVCDLLDNPKLSSIFGRFKC